jgi:hypothetical protein
VTDYYVDIGSEPGLGDRLAFDAPSEPVTIELVTTDEASVPLRRAEQGRLGRLELDLRGVDPGGYLLRVSREQATRTDGRSRRPLQLRASPPV